MFHFSKPIALLSAALIASLTLLVVRPILPSQLRHLVITSDDSGFSAAVNSGTITAMEDGVVTSSSIMVPLPGFPEIADYAVKHPETDFGIHLTLTAEKYNFRWGPVLKNQVPSLVQEDGSFWNTAEAAAAHATGDDVYRELKAQVQIALDRNIPVSHLDHHMWVMLQTPELLRIYLRLGAEFSVPIRLHRDYTAEECGELLNDPVEYQALIQSAIDLKNPLFDLLETNNYDVPPDQKRNYYMKVLRNLKPGFSEFCVHCCENRLGALLPNAPERRQADLTVFTSDEIKDEIQRLGVRLVNWRDLQRLNQGE